MDELKESCQIKSVKLNKCISLPPGNCYITLRINYIIHTFADGVEKQKTEAASQTSVFVIRNCKRIPTELAKYR